MATKKEWYVSAPQTDYPDRPDIRESVATCVNKNAESNALLIADAPELLRQRDELAKALELAMLLIRHSSKLRKPEDYCFKWIVEPLEPCDCEFCKLRAALALVKEGE